MFAMTGCVLAVFVSGNHGQVFWYSPRQNYFHCISLAVIGSTIFCFKSAKPLLITATDSHAQVRSVYNHKALPLEPASIAYSTILPEGRASTATTTELAL